ncbi:MAG TPA: hypothetical protein VJ835_03545, partial [Fimbriimonadaceae bacterium]|nr:hypothetical protein [Fimbriimonadaceae bacterium]
MEISMFGLGFGAPTPSGEQAPVLPGFEGFLTEADAGLEFVSGAPPGPEPPPGEPLPLEEAEELEPNAQPQKLDFQPNLTEKIEVELPEPFWNKGSFSREEPESQSDAPQSDVSVQWLASRLTEGFFQNPVAVVQVDAKPVSPSAATPAVQQKPGQPVISAPTKEFPTSNSVPVAPPNLVPAAPVEGPATTKIDSKSPSTPVTSTENPDPEPNVSQTDDSLGIAPEVIQSPKPQLDSETLAALKPTAIETHSSLVTEVEAGYKEPIIPVAFNPEVQAAKPVMQKGKPVELPKATDTKDSVFTDVPKSDLPESTTLDDSPQVGPENRAPKTSTTGKYEKSESPELPKSEPKKANKGEMSLDVPTKQTQPEFNRFQVALSTDRHSTENALQVEPSRESVPESKLVEV